MGRLAINILGLPGTGKSTLCNDLHEKLGFEIFKPSEVLREYAAAHDIALRGRLDYVAVHEMLSKEDPEAIDRRIFASTAARLCLDGLRVPDTMLKLKERLDAKLFYLECPPETRFARIQNDPSRTGHRKIASVEALLADEAADARNEDQGLPNMEAMKQLADYIIDASVSTDEVYLSVASLLLRFGHEDDR